MLTDRCRAPLLVVAVLIAAAASGAGATAPELELVVPERELLQVGDRLPIRVMARGGEELLWGELRVVVDTHQAWAVVDGPQALIGSEPPVWELTIVPLLIGSQSLPELSVTVRSAGGNAREVTPAVTPQVTITSVLPVLPAGEQVAPAPLRDPIGAAGLPWEWLIPGLLAALPLVSLLGWWQWRRRTEVAAAKPALPPFDELKRLLEALRAGLDREPAEQICDHVAGGVRRFLERRTGEPAQEMTSYELRRAGLRLSWPESVQRSLQRVMSVADQVRFARQPVGPSELGAAVEAALVVARELEAHLSPAVSSDGSDGSSEPELSS